MTKSEFEFIWTTKVAANGNWGFGATDLDTIKLYRDKLIGFKKEILSDALDRLMDSEEGRAKGLPLVGTFLCFCRWVAGEGKPPKTEICPCCCGDGWISLPGLNTSTPCDCNYTVDPEKRISNTSKPDTKCKIGECDPLGFIFPRGVKTKLGKCPKNKKIIKNTSRKKRIEYLYGQKDIDALVKKSTPGSGEES